MPFRSRLAAVAATSIALSLTGACNRGATKEAPPAATATESPIPAIEKWRAKHETDYRRDWVSIAGLHALKQGATTVGSAPGNDIVLGATAPAKVGRFVREDKTVRFEPAPDAPVMLNGERVTKTIELHDDQTPKPEELLVGDIRLVIHLSGETRSLRIRDPHGPLAQGFLGFSWFPIDLQYRVVGHFIKGPQPQRLKVLNTFGEIDEYSTEGLIEFTMLGQTLRLRPFTTRPKRFYIVFKDASSGNETYAAARFLYADLADDGSVVMDFNEAYNPPCAFNPYTTCPIPVRENNLPVRVLAGEKAYPVHVPSAVEAKP